MVTITGRELGFVTRAWTIVPVEAGRRITAVRTSVPRSPLWIPAHNNKAPRSGTVKTAATTAHTVVTAPTTGQAWLSRRLTRRAGRDTAPPNPLKAPQQLQSTNVMPHE